MGNPSEETSGCLSGRKLLRRSILSTIRLFRKHIPDTCLQLCQDVLHLPVNDNYSSLWRQL